MKKITLNKDKSYKIAVFGLSGIGITLLIVPMLRKLKKEFPNSKITYIVRFKQSKKLLEDCPYCDEILVCSLKELGSIRKILSFISNLRRRRFDISITTFPSNGVLKNIFAYLVGAKVKITHSYNIKRISSLSFLQNVRVPVDLTAHDIDQNLNLLIPLGITIENAEHTLNIWPKRKNELNRFALSFLKDNGIGGERVIIGMHLGSSEEFGMIHRRWPVRYFAKLADMIIDKTKAKILIFGGPKEEDLKNKLKELCKNKNNVIIANDLDITQVAFLIKKCSLFISNDSGLMHLAVTQDVRTIGIFGPADPRRTGPYGKEHIVIRKNLACSPCWSLENIGKRFRCTRKTIECLELLKPNEVFDVIQDKIDLNRLLERNGLKTVKG